MTYLQSGLAANDPEFRLRVQACIFKLAQDVINEPNTTPGHPARVSLATGVVQDPEPHVNNFAWLCAANGSIAASVTVEGSDVQVGAPDGDLEFVCASHWDTVAGWRGNRPF